MKDGYRRGILVCNLIQIGAGLGLIAVAWASASPIYGILGLVCASLGLVALRRPDPQQRAQAVVEQLQQQGLYPRGEATDNDVRRLAASGHRVVAVKLYRELHQVPLKQAVEAVKQMA